jgi:hypothetical protein
MMRRSFECKNGTRHSDVRVFSALAVSVPLNPFSTCPAHPAPTRNMTNRVNGPTGRNRANDPRYMSPTPIPVDAIPSSSSTNSLMAWKPGPTPTTKTAAVGSYGLVEKIQPLALASPEEQTDNWDDDFEEGISLTKLQGMQSLASIEEISPRLNSHTAALEKTEGPERLEENAQTIRPHRSPASSANASLVKAPAPEISPIVEDYSDIGDDGELEEKVAHFKVLSFESLLALRLIVTD